MDSRLSSGSIRFFLFADVSADLVQQVLFLAGAQFHLSRKRVDELDAGVLVRRDVEQIFEYRGSQICAIFKAHSPLVSPAWSLPGVVMGIVGFLRACCTRSRKPVSRQPPRTLPAQTEG